MKDKQFEGFFKGILPDTRIEKRAEKIMVDMLNFGNVVVNKFCPTHTDRVGAYRMLGNDIIDYNDLANGLYRKCKGNQHSGHLLCIEDTTEINFSHHLNRIGKDDEDIGPVTKDSNAGFFCHPVLIIDPSNQLPIGISNVDIWNRSWEKLNKYERNYRYQGIKEKESYRWISGVQETKRLLTEPSCLTVIGDRESDIYDEFVLVPDQRTHLLIRSKVNRRLWGEEENLFEKLSSSDQRASYELEIKHNPKRAARKAKMGLKYEKLKIRHPKIRPLEDMPPYVEMWAIEVKELPESVPYKEEPVLWRLLTTHTINCVGDALRCVEWYSQRWLIEELFRVLKVRDWLLKNPSWRQEPG